MKELPTPYYQSDRCTLYCGDCLDILPLLMPGSVDAVVTDPPFGIGFKYATHIDTPDGYGAWLWERVSLAEAACAPASPVFIWQASRYIREFPAWFPREWRLFIAAKNFVQMRPTPMQYAHDPVIVWWTAGEKPFNAGTASRDWHIGNTAPGTREPLDCVDGHPCPRPLNQVRHVVEQWVRPGGTVLEPFAGSGTTAVAAIQLGRKAIGIEIDPAYCAIAARRIKEAEEVGQMFREAAPQQLELLPPHGGE